jgi:hypothetical protein
MWICFGDAKVTTSHEPGVLLVEKLNFPLATAPPARACFSALHGYTCSFYSARQTQKTSFWFHKKNIMSAAKLSRVRNLDLPGEDHATNRGTVGTKFSFFTKITSVVKKSNPRGISTRFCRRAALSGRERTPDSARWMGGGGNLASRFY